MPANFAHNPASIGQLRSALQFDLIPDHNDAAWLRLRSIRLTNQQLYEAMKAAWPAVVGNDAKKYALFHVLGGEYVGVWIHLLPSDDFEHGCHEVAEL
jgi:hypothetical protein